MNFLFDIIRFLPAAAGRAFPAALALAGRFLIYIFIGILSSLTWLWHYLRKDVLPEPKGAIFKIFIWGMLISCPVFLIELGLSAALIELNFSGLVAKILYWFVTIALVEEVFKYLIVKSKILNNPVFDEPTDVMIYMIVAAMGFAGLENILYLWAPFEQVFALSEILNRVVVVGFIRFIGATLLHAVCSGMVGYFVALSLNKPKLKLELTALGLTIAIFLHGLYNFSIIEIGGSLKLAIPIIILVGLSIFVSLGFQHLKKIKSVCKIN